MQSGNMVDTCMHSLVLDIPAIFFGLKLVFTFILCCFGIWKKQQNNGKLFYTEFDFNWRNVWTTLSVEKNSAS